MTKNGRPLEMALSRFDRRRQRLYSGVIIIINIDNRSRLNFSAISVAPTNDCSSSVIVFFAWLCYFQTSANTLMSI